MNSVSHVIHTTVRNAGKAGSVPLALARVGGPLKPKESRSRSPLRLDRPPCLPGGVEIITKKGSVQPDQGTFQKFFIKIRDKTFPCEIFFLSDSPSMATAKSSDIYTKYPEYFPLQNVRPPLHSPKFSPSKRDMTDTLVTQKAIEQICVDTQKAIQRICDDISNRIRNGFPLNKQSNLDFKTQNNLQKEIKERMHDLPEFIFTGEKRVQTHSFLSKKVGVHKLAILSSGIHTDYPKVLGYIGFLNILFLHDDIKVDSLAPSVYTKENKGLLSELHNRYMALYDEVLNSLEKTASWNKEESQIYKDLVIHSDLVDSKFGQAFFLGDAIVRFAQDVYALLSSSFTSPDDGLHAKTNIRREVQNYFLACEEEFENKIKGEKASFVKPTIDDTICSYLDIRRRNGAVAPCFEYVFLMHGLDINMDQIPLIDQWKELRISYIDHICIVNDFLSCNKESDERSPHNLVLVLNQYYQNLEKGFSESKEYLDNLTKNISIKKQAYFEHLKSLLMNDVLLDFEEDTYQTLESLFKEIADGRVAIKPAQTSLDHIKNAYKSILLMEQWADGHIQWEYDMKSKRHDLVS